MGDIKWYGTEQHADYYRSEMLRNVGKQLSAQESQQADRCRSDGHAAPANLGGVNLRDDDPAGHSIAKGMTGDEAHHENQDGHAAGVDVIEPTDQCKRNELEGSPGQDQRLAPDAIDPPEG